MNLAGRVLFVVLVMKLYAHLNLAVPEGKGTCA